RAVKVRQTIGQVDHKGTAAAYRQGSVVGEVTRGREVRAAIGCEAAASSDSVKVRQRVSAIRGVKNLRRRARERDIRCIGENAVGPGGKIKRPGDVVSPAC